MGETAGTQGNGRLIFLVIWCIVAFAIGMIAIQYTMSIVYLVVPFGLGIAAILLCIDQIRSGRIEWPVPVPPPDFSHAVAKKDGKSIYQVPSQCPSCGAAISMEEVDWVGPLQAKCPYCNATVDAQERTL